MSAVRNGHRDIVELLLENGGDINATNVLRSSQSDATEPFLLLFVGIQYRQIEIVECLLRKGASVTEINSEGWDPLGYAIHIGCEKIVNLLLENGANVEVEYTTCTVFCWTPLLLAACLGTSNIVRLLLAKGANIEPTDSLQRTPLYMAVSQGHKDVVELLLQKGSSVDPIYRGKTPLFLAAELGHAGIIMLLLRSGAYIEVQDGMGETPLSTAISHGHKDAVEILLDSGANCRVIYTFGLNPLSRITEKGHENIAKLLIEKGNWRPGFIEALVWWCSTPTGNYIANFTTALAPLVCYCLSLYLLELDNMAVQCWLVFLVVVHKALIWTPEDGPPSLLSLQGALRWSRSGVVHIFDSHRLS